MYQQYRLILFHHFYNSNTICQYHCWWELPLSVKYFLVLISRFLSSCFVECNIPSDKTGITTRLRATSLFLERSSEFLIFLTLFSYNFKTFCLYSSHLKPVLLCCPRYLYGFLDWSSFMLMLLNVIFVPRNCSSFIWCKHKHICLKQILC